MGYCLLYGLKENFIGEIIFDKLHMLGRLGTYIVNGLP